MKTTINENTLKRLISESIKEVLNEDILDDNDSVASIYEYYANRIMSYANDLKIVGKNTEKFIERFVSNLSEIGVNVSKIKQTFDDGDLVVYFNIDNISNFNAPEEYQDYDLQTTLNNLLNDVWSYEDRDENYLYDVYARCNKKNIIVMVIKFVDIYSMDRLQNLIAY